MAVLKAIRGKNVGQLFPLTSDPAVLGRYHECQIVLEAPAVSRQHARIMQVDGKFYLEDLNSRNGTFLNGQLVTDRQSLSDNDQLQICDLVFVFHHGSPDAVAHSPSTATELAASALMADDDTGDSQIISKVDATIGSSGLRLQSNPEMKLKALVELGQSLGRAVGLGEVLNKILDCLFSIYIQADRGYIVLKHPETGRLIPKAVKHRRQEDLRAIRISRTIVNGVIASKEAILSADAAADARFDKADSIVEFQIRSMMCAPLISSDGTALGVIQLDTCDQRSRFNRNDLEVLAAVAGQAAFAVENAQLHEAAARERAVENELALAHRVQQGFLPAAAPRIEGYDFFEFYEPANQLGGDYFDYVPLSGGRWAVVVADVAGKGIAASLLMAKLSAETRYCLAIEPTPAAAIGRLNQVFCDSNWEDRFVTLVLAVLDPARHELTLVNAGHMPPLLRTFSGKVETVAADASGLPIGVTLNEVYAQRMVAIAPGDSLTFYTDGITEAMNARGELYGRPRLWAQLQGDADRVRTLGLRILQDVKLFVGNRAQSDDMCLTCLGRAAKA